MIISASRRTDVPAFYSEWFFNRIRAGEVYVRNPFDRRKISKVSLLREHIDFIHFWTKNPAPMLSRMGELDGYDYAFHFTVNGYGKTVEPHVPGLPRLIETFGKLSEFCPGRVSWRYSPILIKEGFGIDQHLRNFENISRQLNGLTDRCYISLLDEYPKIRGAISRLGIRKPDNEQQKLILTGINEIAAGNGITVYSCADAHLEHGISAGRCLDPSVLGRNTGLYRKDPGQRRGCLCSQSVDIGGYSSCPHDCVYCYANRTIGTPASEYARHDPMSPLITGVPQAGDMFTEHSLSIRARKLAEPNLFGIK